jgi:negative regulator of flagellin synthesis FlgM
MSNKINPVDQGMLGKIGDKIGEATNAKKVGNDKSQVDAGGAAATNTSDTVELTSSAKLLERLDKTLAELSAVDATRIDAVRSAIESGDYSIDAEKIADAMIRFDQELGE